MNIITKSDTKKFIALLKAGLKKGNSKNLMSYSSSINHDGTPVVKAYYVSLEFQFMIAPEHIDEILSNDLMENEIDDLLNDKP